MQGNKAFPKQPYPRELLFVLFVLLSKRVQPANQVMPCIVYRCEVFTGPSCLFPRWCFPDFGQTGWILGSLSCISGVVSAFESDIRTSSCDTDNDISASFNKNFSLQYQKFPLHLLGTATTFPSMYETNTCKYVEELEKKERMNQVCWVHHSPDTWFLTLP